MLSRAIKLFVPLVGLALAPMANAAELVMVEAKGCYHCIEWHKTLGPIYPKTAEGAYAPLRTVDIADAPPKGIELTRRVNFTPTFILVEDDKELARIEGYPGEDFFWGLLTMMLEDKTDFEKGAITN